MLLRTQWCCFLVASACTITVIAADVLLIKVMRISAGRWFYCFARRLPHALVSGCAAQGGTVVNADQQFRADVLIEDGLIAAVAPSLKVPWTYLVLLQLICFQDLPATVRVDLEQLVIALCLATGSSGLQGHRCKGEAGDAGRHRPSCPPGGAHDGCHLHR